MTFREIGKVLGISGERARKIYECALKKLSHPRNKEKLREILEILEEIEKAKAQSDSNTLDFKKV